MFVKGAFHLNSFFFLGGGGLLMLFNYKKYDDDYKNGKVSTNGQEGFSRPVFY